MNGADFSTYINDFNARKQIVPTRPMKRPVGWSKRNRFGLEMRYWDELSDVLDFEGQVKSAMGIPKKYYKCFLEEMEPKNLEQAQIMNAMNVMVTIKDNPLYYLIVCGGNGTGKTYMGAGLVNTLKRYSSAIDKNLNQRDWNPYFVNEADLLMNITGYNHTIDWFTEYTERCRVMVIDEFGMSTWSATDKKRMEQLLFKRHANRFRTVILTNRSQPEISEMVSNTLQSRFEENGKVLNLTGGDLRGSMKESGLGKYWNEAAEKDDPF